MELPEHDVTTPSSIDPSGFWRFVFWLAFVFGDLALAFCWLLAHVPHPSRGADMRLDIAARLCVVVLMLVAIRMARWRWNIKVPVLERVRTREDAMQIVVLIAWVELAWGLIGTIAIALRP